MKQDGQKYWVEDHLTSLLIKKNLKVHIQNTGRLSIKILTVFTSVQ